MAITDPWQALLAVQRALDATELKASPQLFGNRSDPSSILHRQYRINPIGDANTDKFRDRSGTFLRSAEAVTLHLSHEMRPIDSFESYRLAAMDRAAVIDAVVTRLAANADARTAYLGCSVRQAGNWIEQDLRISIEYDLALSAAS